MDQIEWDEIKEIMIIQNTIKRILHISHHIFKSKITL